MSAGNRGVWFDKNHDDCVYADIRPSVRPSVVCDSRALPFSQRFDLIVFDPPHLNFGAKSNMARDYGHHTTAEIRDIVERSSEEAHRVSRPGALMALKWNDHDQKLGRILALIEKWWAPLFGHITAIRTKHACQTQWVMLRRLA